ncbi:MAG: mechanosensitive ion channel family protein [Oscillospiraceae bacterium]|jgi:small conductance mechanosensitive channel|nr:mechanosensitive ion channel family protein [Oscillospiraceae bacterium]
MDTTASELIENVTQTDPASALEGLLQAGWGKLTVGRVLSALLLLLVCLTLARLLLGTARRLVERAALDERIKRYILRGLRAFLYLLTALVMAGSLNIDVSSLIALVGVFGLAVSLAVQDVLGNVAGGMVLLFSKPFTLGDYVSTADGEGEVAEITLTHTKLDTPAGQRVMLPNSKLMAGQIVNYTVRGVRRADHAVSASYDDAPEAVRRACLRALERTPGILPDPAPQVVLTAYGESSIEYRVRFWAKTEDYWDAHFRSLEEIHRAFAEDGVTMTYNHLNVHIL